MNRLFTLLLVCCCSMATFAQVTISTFPYTETFDSIAFDNTSFAPGAEPFPVATNGLFVNNWQNSQTDVATQDWYGRSSATGSSNTGPTADHTGGGRYIFIEDGFSNSTDITLESPKFALQGLTGNWRVNYWIHSQSSTTGQNYMLVELWRSSTQTWTQIDSFGELSPNNAWVLRDISLLPYLGDTVQFRFIGNNSNTSFEHDLALDDFSILQTSLTITATTLSNNFCAADANGAIAVTTSGQLGSLTYNWSGGVTATDTATGLTSGTYTVIVSDSGGQADTATVTITSAQTPITASASGIDENCVGSADGMATIGSISGGTPSGPCITAPSVVSCSSSNLATIGTDSLVLGNTSYPAPFGNWYWGARHQMMWRASELTAAGVTAGMISSIAFDVDNIVGGATTNYTNINIEMACTTDTNLTGGYVNTSMNPVLTGHNMTIALGWNTINFANNFVWDGTSNIVVTFCFNNVGFTRNAPTHYTATSYTSVRYYRADISTVCSNTTSITGTSSNRPNVRFNWCAETPPPYSLSWSNGGTTDTISGLAVGTYTVTVTDAVGCTYVDSVNVGSPAPVVASVTITDITCNGLTDGTADGAATGGTTPYSYAWSNGGTTQLISGLGVGVYTVTVTDANGCTGVASDTVNEPTAVSVMLAGTDVTCNGDDNGTILATPSGGTASNSGLVLITEVDAGSPDFLEIQNVTNTPVDVTGWTIAVSNSYTDINNTNTNTVTLSGMWMPGQIQFWEDVTGANYWGNNLFWNPGSPGWVILVDNLGNIQDFVIFDWNATQIAGMAITVNGFALSPGTAWSGAGITCASGSTMQRTGSADNDDGTDWTCAPVSKGTTNTGLSLNFSGGSTYAYAWSNGDTIGSLDSLGGGLYVVTVSDQNGCSVVDSITILEPDTIGVSLTTTSLLCSTDNNGTASASLTGGTLPYTFNWSTGLIDSLVTTSTDTGLSAGNFLLTVTDANGCTDVSTVPITSPPALTASSSATEPNCFGGADGSGMVTAAGGTPSYAYMWPGGNMGGMQSNLTAGSYDVTVTDSNGCNIVETVNIGQPDSISLNVSTTDAVCEGGSDGMASVAATGGTMPYAYAWTPGGSTTASISGLMAGAYTVQVTDTNGCIKTAVGNVGFTNALPVVNLGPDQSACDGDTVTLSAPGGFTYTWCDGSTAQNLDVTADINCMVTVTDGNGCSSSDDITVTFNPLPTVGLPALDTICEGNEYIITPTQGLTSYFWSTVATTSTISVSTAGTYTVTVTDANGCSNIGSIDLTVDPCVGLPELGNNATIAYFPNPTDGILNFRIEGLEGKDLNMMVLNAQGQLVMSRTFRNVPGDMVDQLDLSEQAQGMYFIRLIADGQQTVHRVSVK